MDTRAWVKGIHFGVLVVLTLCCLATFRWLHPSWQWSTLLISGGVVAAGIVTAKAKATITLPGWVGPGIADAAKPRKIEVNVTEASYGFALIVLGSAGVFPIALATAIATVLNRSTWRGVVFNTCLLTISYTLASAWMVAWPVPRDPAQYGWWQMLGLVLLLLTVPLWEAWNFATLITIRSGRSWQGELRKIYGPEVIIAVVPLAMGFLAGLLWQVNPLLIVPAIVPLLLIQQALQAIARWNEAHIKVQMLARELHTLNTQLEQRVQERTAQLEGVLAHRIVETEDAVHDLRHRVQAVAAAIDLVILRLPNAVRHHPLITHALERVRETTTALFTHLQMVRDAAQMQHGTVQLAQEVLDLGAVVGSVQVHLARQYHALACQLQLDPPPTPLWVTGDRAWLERVVLNILENAATYAADYAATTGQEAHVRVWFVQEATRAGCVVADNGPGLTAEQRQLLGERGVRLSADPRRVEGSGLGLSFCFRALGLMQGQLTIASEGPGQGCTCTIWLPAATTADPPTLDQRTVG